MTALPVFAKSSEEYMGDMAHDVFWWYKWFRDEIVYILIILVFASSGFRILGAILMTKPDAIDPVKKQLFYALCALLFIQFFPAILGAVRNMVQSTAWKPPIGAMVGVLPEG